MPHTACRIRNDPGTIRYYALSRVKKAKTVGNEKTSFQKHLIGPDNQKR